MVEHHWDAIGCDYLLTELAGVAVPSSNGFRKITVTVAEKGIAWRRLRAATTNASTWSRSASRPICGWAWYYTTYWAGDAAHTRKAVEGAPR